MFEKEINNIMSKYKESLKLVNKLQEIYKPYKYGTQKWDSIFYLDIRIESPEDVKNRAFNLLNEIMTSRELRYNLKEKKTLQEPEELARIIKRVGVQDFFESITRDNAWGEQRGKEWEFIKNRYTESRSSSYRNIRILEALQVLKTGEPLDRATKNKIDNVDAGTFIFHGCKIRLFKNGKMIIEFSDAEFLKEFKKQYEKGVTKSRERYELERKARMEA